ncbi:MAG: hypothetical protein OEY14_16780, partial [Myxococcales bacterium]|nr:hypothetical protein [Myxococcales bacterium]
VQEASLRHPLLAVPGFPQRRIPFRSETSMLVFLMAEIQQRRNAIRDTREDLVDEPELVLRLDRLLGMAYARQGIPRDSVLRQLIQDRVRNERRSETLRHLTIAVVSIAIAFVAPVGLAAVAALALSSYDLLEAHEDYESSHHAYLAGLSSDDPSFAWVVVAAVGALAEVRGALRIARHAMPLLRSPVRSLIQHRNLRRFRQELAELRDLDPRVRTAVQDAAPAELRRHGQRSPSNTQQLEDLIGHPPGGPISRRVGEGVTDEMAEAMARAGLPELPDGYAYRWTGQRVEVDSLRHGLPPLRIDESGRVHAAGPTVLRVQGGIPPNASRVRFLVDDAGGLSIQGNDMLFVNVGQRGRAMQFLARRGDQSQLVQFQVRPEFAERLRSMAVPQHAGRQFPGRPQVVDATRAPDQFGIPSNMFGELLDNVVPGSARVGAL